LIVPRVVRDVAGYVWSAGLWVGMAVVVLLLAAAPYFAAVAGRVRTTVPAPLQEGPSSERPRSAPFSPVDTVGTKGN
jgi:hypothetical protein